MAWIESHQDLEKNGKLLELANRLRINRYQAIGHLHALWWWSLDNAEDGNIVRFSSVTVTQACGWSEYINDEIDLSRINEVTNHNKADDFVPALIKCGFLDQKEDGLWIHNWSDYTARYFKSIKINKRVREQTNLRVKKHRECNASVTQEKRSVTVPTIPNQTLPNHTLTTKTLAQAPKRETFRKPQINEIQDYALSIGFTIDAVHFFDHYAARGWQYKSGQPMKDWKAAVRTWKSRSKEFARTVDTPAAFPGVRLAPGQDPWATKEEE